MINAKRLVLYISAVTFILPFSVSAGKNSKSFFNWTNDLILPPASGQSESLGVAGPFAGVSNDALIVAGGANFPKPYWGQDKTWFSDIWVAEKEDSGYKWYTGFKLDRPIAYGMTVTTQYGIVCMGGADANQCFTDVFILNWDKNNKKITKQVLPSMPEKCAFGSATVISDKIYVAGGLSSVRLDSAMKNFWLLDLSKKDTDGFAWQTLTKWPGPQRAFNVTIAQQNKDSNCVYVISGRMQKDQTTVFLKDTYEYDIISNNWRECAKLSTPVCAGVGAAIGQSDIFLFGGADGTLWDKVDDLGDNHPGFPKDIWAYNTISDTWRKAGQVPQTHVTAVSVKWDGKYLIVSGEVRPLVRTPKILQAEPIL